MTRSRGRRSSFPPPPGPIRMYFCGPTVYQRVHVGNARPFVISMWLRRWLERSGYDVTLVHNITDVNDKIYDAAPRAKRRARRTGAATGTSRTRTTSGWAGRTSSRARPSTVAGDRRGSSRSWSTASSRTRSTATCTSGSPSFRSTAPVAANAGRDGRGGAERAQGGSARLRALEGEEAGRGHVLGLAVGPRPARLAHRVLRDGREASGPGVRDPRRRARPRLPPSRERARPVAQPSATTSRRSGCTTACSSSTARRCRSRSATSSRCGKALETWGRETLLVYFLTGALAQADRLLGRRARAGGGAGGGVPQRLRAAPRSRSPTAPGSGSRCARRRLQHAGGARRCSRLARPRAARPRARRLRARVARGDGGGAEASGPARRAARAGARTRGLRRADRLRDEIAALGWEVRDSPAASSSSRDDAGPRLRAPGGARGASRPARRCSSSTRASGRSRGGAVAGRDEAAFAGRAGASSDRARGHVRPPGRRRRLRAVPLRGRVRRLRPAASAARLPRRRHRSAQPRRGVPQRRGGGSDRQSCCRRTAPRV